MVFIFPRVLEKAHHYCSYSFGGTPMAILVTKNRTNGQPFSSRLRRCLWKRFAGCWKRHPAPWNYSHCINVAESPVLQTSETARYRNPNNLDALLHNILQFFRGDLTVSRVEGPLPPKHYVMIATVLSYIVAEPTIVLHTYAWCNLS